MLRAMSVVQVARHFNVDRGTIQRLKARLNQTGSVNDRRRSGRPRCTSAPEDRAIRTIHLRRRFKSASSEPRG